MNFRSIDFSTISKPWNQEQGIHLQLHANPQSSWYRLNTKMEERNSKLGHVRTAQQEVERLEGGKQRAEEYLAKQRDHALLEAQIS